MLEPWVAESFMLPSHSSRLICTCLWDCWSASHSLACLVCHLAMCPCVPPSCLSLPLIPVCMNVSSLPPWLSVPYSSIFCQFWLVFVFKLLSFFWLHEEVKHIYLRLHLGQSSVFIIVSAMLLRNMPIKGTVQLTTPSTVRCTKLTENVIK